jgi:hypothetical protein
MSDGNGDSLWIDRRLFRRRKRPLISNAKSACRKQSIADVKSVSQYLFFIRSVGQRSQNIDLVLGAKHRQLFNVRRARYGENAPLCRFGHLDHHSYKSGAWHRQNKHRGGSTSGASDSMRMIAWQEDIPTRTENCLLSFTNKSKLPIQHKECLILGMVKVIRRGMARRCRMVNQGICTPRRFARCQYDVETVQKPVGWAIGYGYTSGQKLGKHRSAP